MLHPSIGTVIFGRYTLRRELARGGMGSVWEATDRKLRRPVAIKLMYPLWAQSPDALARFEREAMAVAQLQSPHVVQIFDYGVERECPFIVMELLDGEDLRVRIKRCGRLSLDETASIVAQAAKALTAAHAAGIIHRDLKPGNVFLQHGREEELVKLLDFGVAKATMMDNDIDQETTKEGAILGTPRYMSPEQALQSRAVDFRTDLWSLAVIAFRALTGNVPFAGKSPADIIVRLCTEAPPLASSVAPDLGPEVDEFFRRALQRQPERRFRSAYEMALALARIAPATIPSLDTPTPAPGYPAAVAATLLGVGQGRSAGASSGRSVPIEEDGPTVGVPGMMIDSGMASDDDAPTVIAEAAISSTDSSAEKEGADTIRTGLSEPPPLPGDSAAGVVAQFARSTADDGDLGGDDVTLRQLVESGSRKASRQARWVTAALAVVLCLVMLAIGIRRCNDAAEPSLTDDGALSGGSAGGSSPAGPPAAPPADDDVPGSSDGGHGSGASSTEEAMSPDAGESTARNEDPTRPRRIRPERSAAPRSPPSGTGVTAAPATTERRTAPPPPPPAPPSSSDPFADRL